jgi:hypothetical protein
LLDLAAMYDDRLKHRKPSNASLLIKEPVSISAEAGRI